MKQKHFLPVLLLVVVLSVLLACNTPSFVTPTEEPTEAVKLSATPPEPTIEPTPAEPVTVRWFAGLGAGTEERAFEPQQAIVDEFNASQDEIELIVEMPSAQAGFEYLADWIAGGIPPDLAGPMGIRARDIFKGEWLDLQPLIDASGLDGSVYDPAMVKLFQVEGEGQLGLPLSLYPSFIFVNKDLFDKAGLPYPPQEYGAPYVDENGEKKPWNTDTLRELAMKLTLDTYGNNATSPGFNAQHIVQFGYLEQYTDMRGALTLFGPGSLVADDGKTAQMPEHWREGAHWVYDGMWKDHFWPTDAAILSGVLGPSAPFQSGNLAMAHVHLWFAAEWALGDVDFTWDTAAVPSHNGRVTAKMHADTFGILKGSQHPEEAFEVLTYLYSEEISARLVKVYGGMPARLSLQEDYLASYGEEVFPGQDINWQVVLDSIQYADIPNHESWMPCEDRYNGCSDSWNVPNAAWIRLAQEPDLDVDAELDALLEKLQTIYDAVGK